MKKINYIVLALTVMPMILLSGCSLSSTRNSTYSGTVECTEYDIQSEVSGKVTDVFLSESNSVKKGDQVVQIDDKLLVLQLEQANVSLEAANIQLEEAKNGTREEQVRQAEAALEVAKAQLEELESGNRPEQIRQGEITVESAKNNLNQVQNNYDYQKDIVEDYKQLNQTNSISDQQLEQAENLLDQYNHQLIEAKNQLDKANSGLKLLNEGATSSSIDAAKAAVKQAKAQYDMAVNGTTSYQIDLLSSNVKKAESAVNQAKYNLSKAVVTSPIDGTLTSIWVKEGEIVSPGSTIATVNDLNDMWLKVYVEEKNLPKIKLGEKVSMYSSSSDNKIEGKVTYISSKMEFTPKNTETKEARENTVFEVKIQIPPNNESIKPGMNMEVALWNTPSK